MLTRPESMQYLFMRSPCLFSSAVHWRVHLQSVMSISLHTRQQARESAGQHNDSGPCLPSEARQASHMPAFGSS